MKIAQMENQMPESFTGAENGVLFVSFCQKKHLKSKKVLAMQKTRFLMNHISSGFFFDFKKINSTDYTYMKLLTICLASSEVRVLANEMQEQTRASHEHHFICNRNKYLLVQMIQNWGKRNCKK